MKKRYIRKFGSIATTLTLITSLLCTSTITAYGASDACVNWNDERQEVDGFGTAQAADVYGDQLYNLPEPQRTEVMDLLFSKEKGIGLSILRTEVGCGAGKMQTIEPEEGVWNFDTEKSTLWVMKEAQKRGVDKIFSTVWSPPAWMKTNNSIFKGGYLREDCYDKFATYLAKYVKGFKEHHNIDIYAVSIANEPDYAAPWQSCLWDSKMFKDFIGNSLKPVFENEKVSAKVIAGERSHWTDDVLVDSLNDPNACSRIDIVGAHQYHGKIVPLKESKDKGKRVWETEVSDTMLGFDTGINNAVTWAERIHRFMADADANAFNYWLGAAYKKNDEALIRLNEDSTYTVSKRLYALGHFSKFVKPGYIRMGAPVSPAHKVSFSAYKNPNTGEFVIVAVNNSNYNQEVDLVPQGFSADHITPYVTNSQVNISQGSDILPSEGKFKLSLGAKSIITFVGKNNNFMNK